MVKEFQAIIIGAGQAGVPLAQKLSAAGLKTAIIERRYVGGTCINDGCTPTKSWVASAETIYKVANAKSLGVDIPLFAINMAKIKSRKDEIVRSFRMGGEQRLQGNPNLELMYGEASFLDDETIIVKQADQEVKLSAKLIFVNSGCRAYVPDIPGVKEIPYLTSRSILELHQVPEHLLIIGGNFVALEFGQMFRRFGSKVTIVYRSQHLASNEDRDVSDGLKEIFEMEGIELIPNSHATNFRHLSQQSIEVTLEQEHESTLINCSHVLFATGRISNSDSLSIENTNIETDQHGFILVDEQLQTSVPGIYALGDINGGPAFTHISYHDYTIVFRNLIENTQLTTTNRLVPYCIFTDPPLGRIGITEKQAKERGMPYKAAIIPAAHIARALEKGDTRGFIKVIVDSESKLILGAAALCETGGELMTIVQMAMMSNITYEDLKYWIFAHPLYAEAINNLFADL